MNADQSEHSLSWVKSSYSNVEGGECIEWSPEHAQTTGEFKVRDSKTPNGPHLTLTHTAFTGLVTLARNTDA